MQYTEEELKKIDQYLLQNGLPRELPVFSRGKPHIDLAALSGFVSKPTLSAQANASRLHYGTLIIKFIDLDNL